MSKISKEERLSHLRNLIEKKVSISTSDLVDEVDASRMTLFRDLETLQEEGFIERFHGSVTLSRTLYDLDVSLGEMVEEKKTIAKEALEMVLDNDTVFMGSGTTVLELAKLIGVSNLNITLFTNSLPIAFNIYEAANVRLIFAGGDYHQGTRSFNGPIASNSVEGLSGRVLFFGANAIDPDGGITAHFSGQADLINKMKKACKISVALVDSSKFSQVSAHRICNIHDVDFIITDSNLPIDVQKAYREAGAPLVIAKV